MVRVVIAAGLAGLYLYAFFYKLGVPTWNPDERLYAEAGHAYVSDGAFFVNVEHPPFAKYLLGVAQLVGGAGELVPVRLTAALASVSVGALVFLLGRRGVGTRAGLIAAVLWAVLPAPVVVAGEVVSPGSIGRYAILETLTLVFVVASLYGGWRWSESRDWRWAAGTGLAVGLAGASKLPGLLVIVPILALLAYSHPFSAALGLHAAIFLGTAALALVATYLPMGGDAVNAVERMVEIQAEHARSGHLITVGDRLYSHPPWWGNAYFQWKSMGPVASIALVALAVAAFVVVERPFVVYLSIAALAPFLYLSLVAPIALPHYFYLWLPPLVLLAAAALDRLLDRAPALATTAGVALALAAGWHLGEISGLEERDYARVAEELRERGLEEGSALVVGYPWVLEAYLPGIAASDAYRSARPAPNEADALLIDPVYYRRVSLPPALIGFLEAGAPGFQELDVDRLDVYVRATAR